MNTLDTRELNRRLEELKDYRTALEDARKDLKEAEDMPDSDEAEGARESARDAVDRAESDFGDDQEKEFKELEELESEVSEWTSGNTLIPCDDFTDYCQELVSDIGDLPRDIPGYLVIDWEATADNLKTDYSVCTYQGTDYYYRS
jgi:hypothetical protein